MDGDENILVSFYWFTDISCAHQLGLVKHFKIRQGFEFNPVSGCVVTGFKGNLF